MSGSPIVITRWATQAGRRRPAIEPGYVKIDERSFPELLAIAPRFARHVRYFGPDDCPEGDWSDFFRADIAMVLAAMMTFDAPRRAAEFRRLWSSVQDETSDARKFEFINADWNWRSISTKQEIKSIGGKDVLSKHRLLAVACRNLAVNAEENHRYEEASRFRYMAMEARRLERWRGFAFWTLGWWYWLASGYGERVWRAFVVLIGIWLIAAALYMGVGFARWEPRVASQQEAAEARRDEVGESLRWPRSLTYSLGVMTLQKPETRPATNAAQSLVMLETILGPVQAALLALAIRRKFMR